MTVGFRRKLQSNKLLSRTAIDGNEIDDPAVSDVSGEPTTDEPDLHAIFGENHDLRKSTFRHPASPEQRPQLD